MQNAVLLGMLLSLMERKMVTSQELAVKYELSVRSVYRYMDALAASGVPVSAISGKHGGFTIKDDFKLSSVYFTPEEYDRLFQAISSFDVQDAVTGRVKDKVSGLSRALPVNYSLSTSQLVVDTPQTPHMQSKLALLTRSVVTRKVCEIEYHDRKGVVTTRNVKPCCMLLRNGLWYVYAFCALREGFRFFKVSRIAAMNVSEQSFEPIEFDVTSARALQIPFSADNIDFCFLFSSPSLAEVEEWLGVTSVSKVKEGYLATATLPFDDYLIGRLLSFGEKITVIKPEELRDRLAVAAQAIIHRYAPAT